jgi:hypothetical protein
VAQLVAHLHGMQGVRGSSPLSSTEEVLLTERDLVCLTAGMSPGNGVTGCFTGCYVVLSWPRPG